MQTSEMDRKREAFLEHLKQKYPHHATAIMGHQERLRDQSFKFGFLSLIHPMYNLSGTYHGKGIVRNTDDEAWPLPPSQQKK
ncbi:hypothetical protein MJG53_011555 [Ovis ammon polii x Ovis aries]|uniref:Uncharacterized protein n=1 Tax=Ovis ammon polii x Ovis aries TaxID=2918886 RepID=A0ACB9UP10_9CETA|nr:hypothetical protein MJG53_011555 [Ovis ammon polii x Ovis aries]